MIGGGGIGMLAIQWLSMLGVGELVLIEPGRIKQENRTRLPGATRWDAAGGDRERRGPEMILRSLGLVGTKKVNLAKGLARKAAMGTKVTTLRTMVSDPAVLRQLVDSDFIVLAADSDSARYAANRVAHQYLVPVIQAGTKVQRREDASVASMFAVVRPVFDQGCLRCAGLYSSAGLSYETVVGIGGGQRDYGTGQGAKRRGSERSRSEPRREFCPVLANRTTPSKFGRQPLRLPARRRTSGRVFGFATLRAQRAATVA